MSLREHKFVIGSKTGVVEADQDIERTKIAPNVADLTLIVHFEQAKLGALNQTYYICLRDDTGGSAIHAYRVYTTNWQLRHATSAKCSEK
jgi:hypothetical protein